MEFNAESKGDDGERWTGRVMLSGPPAGTDTDSLTIDVVGDTATVAFDWTYPGNASDQGGKCNPPPHPPPSYPPPPGGGRVSGVGGGGGGILEGLFTRPPLSHVRECVPFVVCVCVVCIVNIRA